MHTRECAMRIVGGVAMALSAFGTVQAQQRQDEQQLTEVVVTGSRIARRDLESDSPLVTVDADALTRTNAVTLEDTLNRLPQMTPGFNASSNDTTTSGVTTLSLRGLQPWRTLVLLDGRRLPSATFTGAADANSIPMALIESIEVITGGASAAYGSDAIAGVVNFKLKKNFEGVKFDGQLGQSAKSDGKTRQGSLTFGASVGERGHGLMSIEYAKRDAVSNADREFSRVSRPSSSLPFGTFGPNAQNLPSQAAVDSVFASYGVAAGTVPRTGALGFNNGGSLFAPTGSVNFKGGAADMLNVGGSAFYNSSGNNGLIIPLERYSGFGRFDLEISDSVNAYAEVGLQNFTSATVFAPGLLTSTVPATNPFIPTDLRAILSSRATPAATFTLTRRYADVGFRTADSETNATRFLAGVTGRLPAIDGSWDMYASRGRETASQHDANGFSISALNTLLNAADGGASLCAGGFNPFGANANTACAEYIRRNSLRETTAGQDLVEASVQGRVLPLPAGDLRFALGVDTRSDQFAFRPDSGLASGDLVSFANGAVPAVAGTTRVKEAFGELLVPLLSNLPLAKQVTVTLGYRFSDYNTFGTTNTYRAEGDWRLVPAFRFRGGYSRAVRAPNVTELYSPNAPDSPVIGAAGGVGQGDPCDVRSAYRTGTDAARVRALCLAQGLPASIIDTYTFTNTQIVQGGLTGGNPNLKPETASTYTAGFVFEPKVDAAHLSGVSLSLDYYRINLDSAVGTIAGASAIQRCYNVGGYNPGYDIGNVYCSFFKRDAGSGQINGIQSFNQNLGKIETSGVDLAVALRIPLSDRIGALQTSATISHLDNYAVTNFPGSQATDLAGSIGGTAGSAAGVSAAFPKWRALVDLTWSRGPISAGVQYRYLSAMIDASAVGVANSTAIGTPGYSYFDLNASWAVTEKVNLRLGVVNLADKQPPVYTTFYQSNTYPGEYDVLGRAFYLGGSLKL